VDLSVVEVEDATDLGVSAAPASEPVDSPLPRWGPSGIRRMIATGTIAILVLVVTGWLFIDPIAHLWYQNRQTHLRAQVGSVLPPTPGHQVAVLQNVTTGMNVVVAEGDAPAELRGGPGLEPGTALPGHRGNSVVFGHRGNWGGPFGALDKLTIGSQIYVKSRSGQVYLYTVKSTETVPSSDRKPFGQSSDFRLTLATSAGGVFGDRLLIVTAVSGPQGKLTVPEPPSKPLPVRESALFNSEMAGFLLRTAAAAAVLCFVRRHHQPRIAVILATPVALAALLSLYLALDLAVNPLA
jgi:LPXTG-site transpeptidase (sortase) family protein